MAISPDPLPHLVSLHYLLIHHIVLTTLYQMQLPRIQLITPMVKDLYTSKALSLVPVIPTNMPTTLITRQEHHQSITSRRLVGPGTAFQFPHPGSCLCQGLCQLPLTSRTRPCLPRPFLILRLQLDTMRPSTTLMPLTSQFPRRRRSQRTPTLTHQLCPLLPSNRNSHSRIHIMRLQPRRLHYPTDMLSHPP